MEALLTDVRAAARAGVVGQSPDAEMLSRVAEAASLRDAVAPILGEALSGPRLGRDTVRAAVRDYAPADEQIAEDLERYVERDLAAGSAFEVLCLSNGFHALYGHRLAHALFHIGDRYFARLLQLQGCRNLGVDIHPAAAIGRRVFLDHGVGVVIGETASVGDDSVIFQGVTLGGTAREPGPRHPRVGRRVTVGAGAAIIGAVSIGDDARIGPNAVVTDSVPVGGRVTAA